MEKELLSVDEVSKILTVHPITVRRYIKEKKIKASKVGGQWRVKVSDLKDFMALGSFEADHKAKAIKGLNTFIQGDTIGSHTLEGCVILDYNVPDALAATPLCEKIISKINLNDPDKKWVRFEYFYMETEKKARIVIYGNPKFLGKLLLETSEFDI